MNTVPITFAVQELVHQRMTERARVLGYSASQYARLLFEAAYTARIEREKGREATDKELDRQVVTVFALAGAEIDAIEKATGVPAQRARRILNGWKNTAKPSAVDVDPAATAEGPPITAADTVQAKGSPWSKETVDTVVSMYRDGATAKEIAAVIGRPFQSIQMWISKHRDLCPRRRAAS